MASPLGLPSDGQVKVVYLTALTSQTAPAITELNAAGGIDLSLYLSDDGFNTGGDEASVVDARFADVQTYEQPGRFSDTLDIKYVYQPQTPAAADNKAFATLKRNVTGFIVVRWGKAFAGAFVATDVVDLYTIKCGQQRKATPDANGILRVMQKLYVTNSVARDVAAV